jgi:hypothetical protein
MMVPLILILSMVFFWSVLGHGLAHAAECVGLAPEVNAPNKQDSTLAACSSLASVWAKVKSQKKVGGRQLEKDRPLNPAEAQANLAAAQKDPAIRARLERAAKEIPDQNVRMVYEAAILDEEGFYAARDLKIQLLQQAQK